MLQTTTHKPLRLSKPTIGADEHLAVQQVLASGWLTEGAVTQQFERAVANYVGAKYAIATTSCTTALELCIHGMDLRGRIAIPAFTFPATAHAIVNNIGAIPVLCDVDRQSYNLDVDQLPASIDGVMPVSWGGNPFVYWTSEWFADVPIIEDAACSLGASSLGIKTGSCYTTCFSFHPTKNVTTGEGGVITTNDDELYRRIRSLKNFGESSEVLLSQQWDGQYDYLRWCRGRVDFTGRGTNGKMSDVNAAIGLAQMGKIDQIIDRRIAMAHVYDDLLASVSGVVPPYHHPNTRHTYQCYAVYVEHGNRDQIIANLAQQGIETQIGTYALHLLSAFNQYPRAGSLTNAEKLYRNLLRLPMAHDLTEDDQHRVVDALCHELA